MKFGLYGINGVYNFGCEAIVRGTYQFLKDCRADGEIFYYTYNYDYDSKLLEDLDINLVPIKRNRNIINRSINKALSLLNVEKRILPFNWQEIIDQIDVIVSIGGDMYTIPVSVRETQTYQYYNSLADFCNRAIERGKQVVVYGASMGPWGDYDRAVRYYSDNVSKYRYLICRESATLEYLKSVGVKGAIFQPDPAFLVSLPDNVQSSEKKYVGINFSPLSLRELYGTYSDEMVEQYAGIVNQIIEQLNTDVLLIPHVLSDVESDNDEIMLNKLMDTISEHLKPRVRLAETDKGFLGIKEQLHHCKFIVAARMHCAINAITEGIPAIFLSYSQKSQGMTQYVYGNKKWILSLKKIDTDLIPLMSEMNNCWKDTSDYLNNRIIEIRQEYSRFQEEQRLFN